MQAVRSSELVYLPGLDSLRAAAIGLVLIHNFSLLDAPHGWLERGVGLAASLGWVGVQLFFVLSGFLITRQLIATQDATNYLSGFYWRRALRIFPLYFLSLLILTVLLPGWGVAQLSTDHDSAVWLWLYLSNWTEPLGFGTAGLPHFWSLAVEEQFYLVWPLLLLRRKPQQVLHICLGLIAISFVWRLVALGVGLPVKANYSWTPARMDALAFGGALAAMLAGARHPSLNWLAVIRQPWRLAALLFTAGFILTHGYPQYAPVTQAVAYLLLALVFTLAIEAAIRPVSTSCGTPRKCLATTLMSMVAKLSYAAYVIHKPLHDTFGVTVMQPLLNRAQPALASVSYSLAMSLLTLTLAWVSYQCVEQPFLKLKTRFAPKYASPPP